MQTFHGHVHHLPAELVLSTRASTCESEYTLMGLQPLRDVLKQTLR